MKNTCDKCGREAQEGECFVIKIDPSGEWWKHLFDGPAYCQSCVEKMSEDHPESKCSP